MPRKQTNNTSALPAPLLSIAAGDPAMLMARVQASTFKAVLKWQIESLNFLRHRYEQDVKFIDELLSTPEPGEMLSTCSCFMQNALDEYSKEAVKAANYGGRIITDTAKEIRSEAEKVSEDMMAATLA
jgi:hypothetical protein